MNNHHSYRIRRVPVFHGAFTLVEALIAMTIFGLAIAGVMSAFIGTLKSTHAISDAIDVNARSRFIQERLLFDLRAIIEVKSIGTPLNSNEVRKIFSVYTGAEIENCFRSFTATINEYNGSDSIDVTYTIVADGTTPMGTNRWALQRTIGGGESQKVLTNLNEGCFTFYTRKKSTGTLQSLAASGTAQTNAIRFAFIPRDRGPLIPGQNDPSCSAVVQLRYPSYK